MSDEYGFGETELEGINKKILNGFKHNQSARASLVFSSQPKPLLMRARRRDGNTYGMA